MNPFDSIEIPKEKHEALEKLCNEMDEYENAMFAANRRRQTANKVLWDGLQELFPEIVDWNCIFFRENGVMQIRILSRKVKP